MEGVTVLPLERAGLRPRPDHTRAPELMRAPHGTHASWRRRATPLAGGVALGMLAAGVWVRLPPDALALAGGVFDRVTAPASGPVPAPVSPAPRDTPLAEIATEVVLPLVPPDNPVTAAKAETGARGTAPQVAPPTPGAELSAELAAPPRTVLPTPRSTPAAAGPQRATEQRVSVVERRPTPVPSTTTGAARQLAPPTRVAQPGAPATTSTTPTPEATWLSEPPAPSQQSVTLEARASRAPTAADAGAAPVPPAPDATAAPPPSPAPSSAAAAAASAPAGATAALPTSEEPRIRAVLGQYEAAYGRLDASAARAVWPTVDSRALARAFDGLESQRLVFDHCDLTVTGAKAQAACRGSATYVPRVGDRSPRTEPRQWSFQLEKVAGDRWQILGARIR